MGETLRFSHTNKKLELRISATQNFPKSRLLGSLANKSSKKTLKCVTSVKVSMAAKGDIGAFLLTTAALEIVRRFSSSHCPFIWRGLQTLQILNCPPFKWLQKWAPFTGLVKGMQVGYSTYRFWILKHWFILWWYLILLSHLLGSVKAIDVSRSGNRFIWWTSILKRETQWSKYGSHRAIFRTGHSRHKVCNFCLFSDPSC